MAPDEQEDEPDLQSLVDDFLDLINFVALESGEDPKKVKEKLIEEFEELVDEGEDMRE